MQDTKQLNQRFIARILKLQAIGVFWSAFAALCLEFVVGLVLGEGYRGKYIYIYGSSNLIGKLFNHNLGNHLKNHSMSYIEDFPTKIMRELQLIFTQIRGSSLA